MGDSKNKGNKDNDQYIHLGSGSQQSANSQEVGAMAQLHKRMSFLNPWRNREEGSDSGTADLRAGEHSGGGWSGVGWRAEHSAGEMPGRSQSPVGSSAKKRSRVKEHRSVLAVKKRRVGTALPASYKGSYKLEDSYSSSDESGQEDRRPKAAAAEVISLSLSIYITCYRLSQFQPRSTSQTH